MKIIQRRHLRHTVWLGSVLCALMFVNEADSNAASPSPFAAEKFIPSFTICYSNARGARSPEETARFDLLLSATSKRAASAWGQGGRNSWQTLKALHPGMVVALYVMGPGEYNTADWGQMGEGWDWLKQHHGKDAADRWIAVGQQSGGYLRAVPYPNERLMEYGNANWQRYWCDTVYQDLWQGRKGIDCQGADGVFSDNTSFQVAWAGQWRMESQPDQPDVPTTFYADGKWRHDLWQAGFFKFINEAVPRFGSNQLKLVVNTGQIGRAPETWRELDAAPNPPFAAMEEGGFVCPWGGDQKSFKFWDWEKKLAPFSRMRHVKVLMCNHAGPFAGQGLAAMDSPDANGMTGWDALWFSLTSFLLGFDDVSRNGLMNFTIWGYSEYHWFDEFDPQCLHLGKAVSGFEKRERVHFREFEDGWVAVNGEAKDATDVKVPSGSARVLNHANFKNSQAAPLVTSFDLPAHRGVVLLREGKRVGNADNPR
ncbi:MAG: hypothetical protein HZA90_07200 [Verrucomicrobia bacterium]|nr:hypothetical protein [Verrucomicrobiota bacterium]